MNKGVMQKMVNKELAKENEYLQFVYEKLKERKEDLEDALEENKSERISVLENISSDVRLNFDNISDNLDTFTVIEMKNREIDQMNLKMKNAELSLQKVKRLLESPYFGKVEADFLDQNPVESFYIGVSGFSNENREYLVYDWRSPIAELFYNNTLGQSHYFANDQQIDVSIKGRRQFIIKRDKLLNFFDTSVAIQDDVLLAALEQNSSERMHDITTTIQKEQNVIIRDTNHPNILVNGVAGSGKTSTIMQRIAYLLYSLRHEITSDNVMILSPNNKFIHYISAILPSLGEKNPSNMTLLQFVQKHIRWPMETEEEYFSRISKMKTDSQDSVLRSSQFVDFIKSSTDWTLSPDKLFKDLTHNGKVVVSKTKMIEIYETTPPDNPIIDRIQATKKRLSHYWQRLLIKKAGSSEAKDQMLSLSEDMQMNYFGELISDDSEHRIVEYAEKLLRKKYRKITNTIKENKWIDLTYIFDVLYMSYQKETYIHSKNKLNLDEAVIYLTIMHTFIEKIHTPMRFVLIDEVQDYTPSQMSLLSDLFAKSDFTMVGDENQAIFNSAITFHEIESIFNNKNKEVQRYDLLNSYRSSKSITNVFSQLVTSDQQMEIIPIRPEGNKPRVFEISDKMAFNQLLDRLLADLDEQELTIITKSEDEAKELSENLSKHPYFASSIQVLPISLSKGMEFDNALIFNVSEDNYTTERDKKILYTAVSRGMQNLYITYTKNQSKLLTMF